MSFKDYKKGDKGIYYKATIGPYSVKRGGSSLLEFKFVNPTDKPLTPRAGIVEIEKKGFIGGRKFKPRDGQANNFWVGDSASVPTTLMKGDQGVVILPLKTHLSTDPGDYDIQIGYTIEEKSKAVEAAKTVAKIALALTVGSFNRKQIFKMKVEEEESSLSSDLTFLKMMMKIAVRNPGPFGPLYVTMTKYTEGAMGTPEKDGLIEFVSVNAINIEDNDGIFDTLKGWMMDDAEVNTTREIGGVQFEYRSGKVDAFTVIHALGLVPEMKRFILIRSVAKDSVVQPLLDLIDSITFVPKE